MPLTSSSASSQRVLTGKGHGFGVQLVSAPWKRPPCVRQSCSVATTHRPLSKQQAPVAGCGHGFGLQVEPSP